MGIGFHSSFIRDVVEGLEIEMQKVKAQVDNKGCFVLPTELVPRYGLKPGSFLQKKQEGFG